MTDLPQQTLVLKDAETNPWYRLATLYGLPKNTSDPIHVQNRNAWNRYVAELKSDRITTILITDGTATQQQIVNPYDPTELLEFRRLFAARSGQSAIPLPELPMDFSSLQIKYPFLAKGYLFTGTVTFDKTEFDEFVDFEGSSFENDVQFEATVFHREADFTAAAIGGKCLFAGARFEAKANFTGSNFSGETDYSAATFSYDAYFDRSSFKGSADFYCASFEVVYFQNAIFEENANFICSNFNGSANFRYAKIAGYTNFTAAKFNGFAQFADSEFSKRMFFTDAIFAHMISFQNVKFPQPASFHHSKFLAFPPLFTGATLHEGTDWEDVRWPGPPKSFENAKGSLKAYERLKLEMDKLKKHEAELDFFARELQCRRILNGYWGGLPIAAYAAVCDYGRRYDQPLFGLFWTWFIGTMSPLNYNVIWKLSDYSLPQSMWFSFLSLFGAFGFGKDFFSQAFSDPATHQSSLPTALQFVSLIESITGPILLFFFGLALRNRFRMK